MTVLGSLLRDSESRAVNLTAWGDWSGGTDTYAGVQVSNQTALQLLTVYGCNRFICDGISTLPVDVYRRDAEGAPVALRTPSLIQMPTVDLDFTAWATQFLTSLLMAGNFYGFKDYANGALRQVIPLDPEKVRVERQSGRKVFIVEGRTYTSFEVLHVPGVMWPGSDVGLSPLEAARQTIGAGLSAVEYTSRFFGQGQTMSGVIEVPGELTPEQTRDMARAWSRKHSGKDKAHLPGVLQGGAQWKATGVTNDQAQFLETRKFTASQIAAEMFFIDPVEMGLPVEGQSLTYTNQEQRNTRKVQVTFLPWITRLEAALTSLLPRPQYVKLNVNGLLRGDSKTRMEAYAIGIQNEFLLPNEARAFEDMRPIDGGDTVVKKTEPAPVVSDADRALMVGAITHRRLDEVAEQRQEPPVVNVTNEVPAPEVPELRVEPVVNIAVPAAAPVEAPVVNITNEVHPAPVNVPEVRVEAPVVNVTNEVQPAEVTVIDEPKTRTVIRDKNGNIVKVVEE